MKINVDLSDKNNLNFYLSFLKSEGLIKHLLSNILKEQFK